MVVDSYSLYFRSTRYQEVEKDQLEKIAALL